MNRGVRAKRSNLKKDILCVGNDSTKL